MEEARVDAQLEAILFAAGEPVEVTRLASALDMKPAEIESALARIARSCAAPERGIALVRLETRVQLATKPEYGELARDVLEQRRTPQLTAAALEVLSVAAYRQPVTRLVIDELRGADSAYTVSSLVEKGLLEESGRLDAPGRPILYRTTDMFLRVFGLGSLEDLPPLPEDDAAQLSLSELEPDGE